MSIYNKILNALLPQDREVLIANLEPYHFSPKTRLYDGNRPAQYLYFPTTSILSLCYIIDSGELIEVAIVGNDGVAGVSLFLSDALVSPEIAVVQSEGDGYRLNAKKLKQLFLTLPSLQTLLLRSTQFQLIQTAQSVACNRYHHIDAQLSRWLLNRLDRLPGNYIEATHESIATLLGVRREGVSKAAHALKESGIIHYQRGKIEVLDREGLEESACECYFLIKNESEHLFTF